MSLVLDVDTITAVLIANDWYKVRPHTFTLDSYEYIERDDPGMVPPGERPGFTVLHGGGGSGVCATGFEFTQDATGDWIAGPLTAILAVRRSRAKP